MHQTLAWLPRSADSTPVAMASELRGQEVETEWELAFGLYRTDIGEQGAVVRAEESARRILISLSRESQ
jgi:hypothetical protein